MGALISQWYCSTLKELELLMKKYFDIILTSNILFFNWNLPVFALKMVTYNRIKFRGVGLGQRKNYIWIIVANWTPGSCTPELTVEPSSRDMRVATYNPDKVTWFVLTPITEQVYQVTLSYRPINVNILYQYGKIK